MSISQDQAIEALNAQRNSQIYRMLLDERDQSYDDIPEVPASPAVEAQANEVLQHIDRAVRAIPTDEAEVQDFVDSMDAIQPVVSDVNDTELPPVTEGRHRYNLEEAVARLSPRRERSEMQEEAERQRINNETPNTDSARRVTTSEERIAAVASNIRDELTNIARDVVGEMDTPSLRQTIVRRIGDLQTRYQEVLNSTDNNNATTWLSTRGTISHSTDASYQYTVNGQPWEADMNSMYTTASSIPKIDFAEYMKSPDRITIRTISDYIDELRKFILEKRIMVADVSETRSTYPSSTTAVLLESERALTLLRQKVVTLDLAKDLLTNPNDRKEFIDDISQGCSLFFRLFEEWQKERDKDFYSTEEEADIGRMLADYLDLIDDSYLSLGNHFIDGFREQIKDAAWQVCRTLMGSRSPLTNRYNELLEHKKIALTVSVVDYSASRRIPMTEHLMCKIVQDSIKLSAKYTKEDSQRIFRAIMRDIDNSRRKLNSGIMETLRPRIKDIIRQAAKDRNGSIIDFEALLNDKMKIDVYAKFYRTEFDKDAFFLTIEIEQKSVGFGNLIKSFADRKQVLRFLETEMIKPYSKFNRERCEELLNGLRANFRCVTDSPFHEVFALIKNLTPLASFSELRPTFSYVKSEVFDYPFTVIIRSDELKVIRFLKTIYSMVDSIEPGSSDFVLEQVNNGEGYWVVAVPVEFMIKFLGYTRFAKFLNDRRETEINALMAALAYENTFESKRSPIVGYWDNQSYISDEHLGYRLHRFSKKGVDDFRPKFVHSIEWGKDVTDYLQYADWREWDRASEWDRIQRFERILKDFIQTSFKNSIIPSPADEGFLHVFMKTLLWNQHTLIQTLPFRFDSDTVYKVFKDRLSEVIEDRIDENCTKLEIIKKLKEVIEKKHLIFHPVVDSMRKFIAELSVNSGSDFFDPSAIG